jgi:restriction endonuclease
MKIKFDGNQDFQWDAIRSVVEVFAGQTRAATIPQPPIPNRRQSAAAFP